MYNDPNQTPPPDAFQNQPLNEVAQPAPQEPVNWKVERASGFKNFVTSFPGVLSIVGILVLITAAVLFIVPETRYALGGLFIKKPLSVKVINEKNNLPVSDAWVSLGNYGGMTDYKGEVTINSIAVGEYILGAEKKFFQPSQATPINVPLVGGIKPVELKVNPTGSSVNVIVKNQFTLQPVPNVKIKIGEATASAGPDGKAHVVLKANSVDVVGDVVTEITANNYEMSRFQFANANAQNQPMNIFMLPSDDVYYLSNYNATVDVIRTKLDGTKKDWRETIVKGVGSEADTGNQLVASRDWEYLALLSTREGESPRLHLVKTASKKLSSLDNRELNYEIVGWIGHKFIYKTTDQAKKPWQNGVENLVSFDAKTGKRKNIAESIGYGRTEADYATQKFSSVAIMNDKLVYGTYWQTGASADMTGLMRGLITRDANGENLKRIKEDPQATPGQTVEIRLATPQSLLAKFGANSYYRYEQNLITHDIAMNDAKYAAEQVIHYIPSPNNEKTLWSERQGDGQYKLMIGDKAGKPSHEIGVGPYRAYGWVSNDYVLLSRDNNELYTLYDQGVFSKDVQPTRTSDYLHHETSNQNFGVGYGIW